MSETEDPETEEEQADFEEQERRNTAVIPNVLNLDVSGSMSGDPIAALNGAMKQCKQDIVAYKTEKTVDISVVTFGNGGVTIEQEFTRIPDWNPSELTAGGSTPMCEALIKGVNHMEQYRDHLEDTGTPKKKGLVWVLTDGRPKDMNKSWKGSDSVTYGDKAKELVEQGTEEGDLLFYFVGVGPKADMDMLEELADAAPDSDKTYTLELEQGMFQEFFKIMTETATDHARGKDNPGIQD